MKRALNRIEGGIDNGHTGIAYFEDDVKVGDRFPHDQAYLGHSKGWSEPKAFRVVLEILD